MFLSEMKLEKRRRPEDLVVVAEVILSKGFSLLTATSECAPPRGSVRDTPSILVD